MTTREFYLSVVNGTGTSEETMAKARELLEKHDASNEKRKGAESKEKIASRGRRESVLASLSESPMTADTIAENLGITVGQSRSALGTLVREGIADKTEVKVGKSRKMVYTLHIGE